MTWDFDAYVTAAHFEPDGEAVFALGDGQVRWEGGAPGRARRRDPRGDPPSAAAGLITGGDDGRLVWSRRDGVQTLAEVKGRWIESLAAAAGGRLVTASASARIWSSWLCVA